MPIDPTAVGHRSEPHTRRWTAKDAALYALGVGAGQLDPVASELEFTTENLSGGGQQVLPTFGVIVGAGFVGGFGTFNPVMLVHGEQAITLHQPLPPEGTLEATSEIVGIYDKGSGAAVVTETRSVDAASGAPLLTLRSTMFLRGEGGFGGDRGPARTAPEPPDRAPDHSVTYDVPADQALLYRLSGDRNPLHCDPGFAQMAGYPRPILHGLCTYGYAGRALLHTLCGSDPARFVSMEARFSKPVLPGDALTTDMWVEGDRATFRTTNQAGAVVLAKGLFCFAPECSA